MRAHHAAVVILSPAGKSWEAFLMLHPPALGMEEGDLCKRHGRWTLSREKHLKVCSLPTVKNMCLAAGREGGCALTIPLSAQVGSRTWAVLQQIWPKRHNVTLINLLGWIFQNGFPAANTFLFWAAGLQQLEVLPREGEAFEESGCEHPMTQELGSGSVLTPSSAAHTAFFLAPVALLSTSRRH